MPPGAVNCIIEPNGRPSKSDCIFKFSTSSTMCDFVVNTQQAKSVLSIDSYRYVYNCGNEIKFLQCNYPCYESSAKKWN